MTDWILPSKIFFFPAFNDQIREREKMHTWDAPLFLLLSRKKESTQSRKKKSVYGVRPVTYLVNDGFLKPTLIYRLRLFAL